METVGSDTENEDLSDCDDEPDDGNHDDDDDDDKDYDSGDGGGDSDHHGNEEVTPSRKMNVDEQLQTETETPLEPDPLLADKIVQVETKRKMAEQEKSSPQEPPTKQQKSDTLVSKLTKAIEQVLGTCEEVLKFEKLLQKVG